MAAFLSVGPHGVRSLPNVFPKPPSFILAVTSSQDTESQGLVTPLTVSMATCWPTFFFESMVSSAQTYAVAFF